METLIPQTDPAVVEECVKQGIPLVSPQKAIAARIPNNKVLADFICAIESAHRMNVYEGIVPHLSFKAKPFWWLMARRKKRARKNS